MVVVKDDMHRYSNIHQTHLEILKWIYICFLLLIMNDLAGKGGLARYVMHFL